MSNFTRNIARRTGQARKPRVIFEHAGPGRRKAKVVEIDVRDPETGEKTGETRILGQTTGTEHGERDTWWSEQLAKLVDKRLPDGTYPPKERKPETHEVRAQPQMVAREPGMTRQVQRKLYRQICKAEGLPSRKTEK